MNDNNQIQVVEQLDAQALTALEPHQRMVLLSNEMGTNAEVSKEALALIEAQQKLIEAEKATARFWHDLVPGRRTALPAQRHFQPRYGTIQHRKKLKRSLHQRDLVAQSQRRSYKGWVKQYLARQIDSKRLKELVASIGATKALEANWTRITVQRCFSSSQLKDTKGMGPADRDRFLSK